MKTVFFTLTPIVIFIICISTFFMTGCPKVDPSPTRTPTMVPTETPPPTAVPTQGSWTIMVYLDADNNLETYGIDDMNEMEAVDLTGTGINVIVLLDRISGYDTSNGNWTDSRVYHVEYDPGGANNEEIVSTELYCPELTLTVGWEEEVNMGDPDVCSGFIDFCKTGFPADDYFLIFWDHGSGWMKRSDEGGDTRGVCFDDSSGGDCLYTKEISDAIEGKGLTMIGFDACLEGMLEVAYEVRTDTSYMVGSEEVEGGDGWEYNYWLSDFAESGLSAGELYTALIDAYQTHYSSMTGATLSAIDLSQVNGLMTAMNNFSDAVYAGITTPTIQGNIQDTLLIDVEKFWDTYTQNGDVNLDIWDLADVIETDYDIADTQAAALKTAVEAAVVDEWHHTGTGLYGNPNAHGIAIHCCRVSGGDFYTISYAYMNGYNWDYVLEFVGDSTWVPHYNYGPVGPGLLYRVWYEDLSK